MKNSLGRIKDAFIVPRDKHAEFRNYFAYTQGKGLLGVSVFLALWGLAAVFLSRGTNIYDSKPHTAAQGLMLFIIATITVVALIVVFSLKKVEKKHKDVAIEMISLLSTIGYIIWTFQIMWDSVKDGLETNYLPTLIMYTACNFFLYFSVQHYYAFFLFCCGGAAALVISFPDVQFDSIVISNVVIFGAILTAGSVVRYLMSSRRFFAAKKAEEMGENLVAFNQELTATNEELMELTETLRKKNDIQRLFTAGMSHELRSPLNGIIGLLQVVEEDKTLSEDTKDNIDKALSSSVTLIQIVNDLLDYYKLEAGEFNIVNAEFDIREIVEGIMNVSQSEASVKGLKLTFAADENMPAIFMGDGLRIRQVITNIVTNGIKYTEKGYVHTTFSYVDDILTIVTEDSGQGISDEAKGQLFDPFKRFNENKNKYIQGTGLGLSICKKLIEQMGGEITLESEINKGSKFTVRIPVDAVKKNIHFGDVKKTEIVKTEIPDLNGKKFLCVDDNRVNLQVFKGLLKGTGAELILIKGGKECLEKVKEEKFDIIFLDHLMPEMDGVETFENMKYIDHLNTSTPVVMLTANAGAEAEQSYMDRGFNGYLSKPVLRTDLYKMIDEMLSL